MSLNSIHAESEEEFISESVRVLTEAISRAFEKHDSCMLGLSGGSTPRPTYESLGKEDIDWSKITIFLVDERYVPSDHKDSNQKMILETFLKNADIPESNIYFPDTTLSIEECMEDYAAGIQMMIDSQGRQPDVMALGMGPDGHIASLFPNQQREPGSKQLVLHTTTDEFAVHDRITLTLNAIAAAKEHIFFLKGEDKKKMWEEMMDSEEDERRWPAKRMLINDTTTVVTLW